MLYGTLGINFIKIDEVYDLRKSRYLPPASIYFYTIMDARWGDRGICRCYCADWLLSSSVIGSPRSSGQSTPAVYVRCVCVSFYFLIKRQHTVCKLYAEAGLWQVYGI